MSIRKRPTREGARRVKALNCSLDELPLALVVWQLDYKDTAGVRRHRQFATQRAARNWETDTLHAVKQGTHTPRERHADDR